MQDYAREVHLLFQPDPVSCQVFYFHREEEQKGPEDEQSYGYRRRRISSSGLQS